jgi:hypothetical protein
MQTKSKASSSAASCPTTAGGDTAAEHWLAERKRRVEAINAAVKTHGHWRMHASIRETKKELRAPFTQLELRLFLGDEELRAASLSQLRSSAQTADGDATYTWADLERWFKQRHTSLFADDRAATANAPNQLLFPELQGGAA